MAEPGSKPKRGEVRWSPEIAYAVGLIATDGCLSTSGRHIELTSKDEEQLTNFMQCIGKEVPISRKLSGYTGQPVTRIQFSDITLYKFLLSIGLTTRKTHTLGEIDVPDHLFFDFLRGHHDGDGSFYSYLDSRWKNSFMFYLTFASASAEHIEWLRSTLSRLLNIKGHIGKSERSRVLQLKYAKREALLILKEMYRDRDAICLKRKRLKITHVLRIVGESLPGQMPR
jgi:hypothetical protein